MTTNNRVIIDLRKVSYALLVWRNEIGQVFCTKPKSPTFRGEPMAEHLASGETTLERMARMGFTPDTWTPVLKLQLSNAHRLNYTGTKALKLYDAWCARVFGKQKQQN